MKNLHTPISPNTSKRHSTMEIHPSANFIPVSSSCMTVFYFCANQEPNLHPHHLQTQIPPLPKPSLISLTLYLKGLVIASLPSITEPYNNKTIAVDHDNGMESKAYGVMIKHNLSGGLVLEGMVLRGKTKERYARERRPMGWVGKWSIFR